MTLCKEYTIHILIEDIDSLQGQEADLQLVLPCGFEYIFQSIVNAIPLDITDRSKPSFSLPQSGAGNNILIEADIQIPCNSQLCLESPGEIQIIANLQSDGLHIEARSDPISLLTALPLIKDVDKPLITGSYGSTVERKIFIRNTREGRLDSVFFIDSFGSGIEITTNLGDDVSNGPGVFTLRLDGDDFVTIGNGDRFLDRDEEICITETIYIKACGFEQSFIRSDLDVQWGCYNSLCPNPFDPQITMIQLESSVSEGPILNFTPQVNNPDCFCSEQGTPQSMVIENLSDIHDAKDLVLMISTIPFPNSSLKDSVVLMVHSNGSTYLDVLFESAERSCDQLNEGFSSFFVNVPLIPAGESVTISWDTYFCDMGGCNADLYKWSYEYYYLKDCTTPNDIFHDGNEIATSEIPTGLTARIEPIISIPYQQETVLNLNIGGISPAQNEGTVDIMLEVPCILEVTEEEWRLGETQAEFVSIHRSDTISIIRLKYPLPLASENVALPFSVKMLCSDVCQGGICENNFITSCASPCVSQSFIYAINYSVGLNYPQCNSDCLIEFCGFDVFPYDCDLPVCDKIVPGYFNADFDFYRLNLGEADNDNDHYPDLTGSLLQDSIRRDRAVTGDTLRAEIRGVIVGDIVDVKFDRGMIEIGNRLLRSEGLDPSKKFTEFSRLLNRDIGLQNINARLDVYDKDRGVWYGCTHLPYVDSDSVGFYAFDIDLVSLRNQSCNIPQDYFYQDGDSILLTADFKINYNIQSQQLNFGFMEILFENSNIIYPEIEMENEYEAVSCSCSSKRIEIANYKTLIRDDEAIIGYCKGASDDLRTIIKFGTYPDWFPYEYKPPLLLDYFTMPRIEGLELINVEILSVRNNNVPIPLDPLDPRRFLNISQIQNNLVEFEDAENITGFYIIDPNQDLGLSWDENIEFQLAFHYKNTGCLFTGSERYFGRQKVDFSPAVKASRVLTSPEHLVALKGARPDVDIEIDICQVSSFTDTLRWQFEAHTTILQPGVLASEAAYVWFEPVSMTGDISNFKLYNTITGDTIPELNGIFYPGTISLQDTKFLELEGISTSCTDEQVLFRYGWSCSENLENSNEACFKDSVICLGRIPPGVIDIQADSIQLVSPLCDTFGHTTVELFNAGLGNVYDITPEAFLPTGMSIVKGSSHIEYPSGSQNIFLVEDPLEINPGHYAWTIDNDSLSFDVDGLPGINSAPFHSFNLRFLTHSGCNFLAGSNIVFRVGSTLACGEASNTASSSSGDYLIMSENQTAQGDIRISFDTQGNCTDIIKVTVNVDQDEIEAFDRQILLQFSSLLEYVEGSCFGDIVMCEPESMNGQLVFQIPEGAGVVQQSFLLSGRDSLLCSEYMFRAFLTQTASAECIVDSSECFVQNVVAQTTGLYLVEKLNLDISDARLQSESDSSSLSVSISNTSFQASDSVTISLFFDSDLSGNFSTGDSLILDKTFINVPHSGSSLTYQFDIDMISPEMTCHLIVVLEDDKNCICQTDQHPVAHTDTIIKEDKVLCSGDTLLLEVEPKTGARYHWLPTEQINCDTCPSTLFSLVNDGFEPTQYALFLNEDIDGCQVIYQFNIEVRPSRHILSPDIKLCKGDSVTLVAFPGEYYEWRYQGHIIDTLQQVTIKPGESGHYLLMGVESEGCGFTDSVFIEVIDTPVADAGPDVIACPGSEVFLSAMQVGDSLSYQWQPGIPYLDSPNSPVTRLGRQEPGQFTLQVSNQLCTSTDTVNVYFEDRIDLPQIGDFLLCEGDTFSLTLQSDYHYEWQPAFLGMCQDTLCSSVEFIVFNDHEMNVIAIDEEGCRDSVTFLIDIENSISRDTLMRNICPGDSFTWMGESINAPGTYCDTIRANDVCQAISCLLLSHFPQEDLDIQTEEEVPRGTEVQLLASSGFISYQWQETNSLNCLDCSDPTAILQDNEWFVVTVEDENGCTQTDSVFIRVTEECDPENVLIPNAFTPNDNNKNDKFRIANELTTQMRIHMRVYDRWGELVYEGLDNQGWDGSYNGEALPEGVYLYIIEVNCDRGEVQIFTGDVTLIR